MVGFLKDCFETIARTTGCFVRTLNRLLHRFLMVYLVKSKASLRIDRVKLI